MKSRDAQPKGWPQDVQYLSAPSYAQQMSKQTFMALHTKPNNAETIAMVNGPSSNVEIRTIAVSTHPAYGQHGLFARKDLPPGSFILFYVGVVHTEEDSDCTSDYDLSLDRELGVGIDAAKAGNEARFINDYRGISAKGPNAEFREVWVDRGKDVYERRMAVFVLPAGKSGKRASGIRKGEEILVSYGKGFWKERQAGKTDVE
ncbi:uncharacterized protein PV09_03521 [Verruconis gallopava]|uniref:SET domain-containing protein n=1 Tax=Verruconis gallopava TaxID=253628 RepID=A0A0D2AGF9_9PEZI|nr:uncharacterized protein PV09_03521 [Verruconis gallopava]KIW05655.1 hypothetical protein PV09_03521 [Verruconis gallopava]